MEYLCYTFTMLSNKKASLLNGETLDLMKGTYNEQLKTNYLYQQIGQAKPSRENYLGRWIVG